MTTTFLVPHHATPGADTGHPPPRAAFWAARWPWTEARLWITAGTALLVVLQLGALGAGLDPVRSTISDLFYAPGGSWLLTLSGGVTLTGGVILARSARRAGHVGAAGFLALWCVGLAIATLLPTDPPGATTLSVAAEAHRWAAAVMFAATPIAGFLVARRIVAAVPLSRQSRICAAAGLAQFAFCLPSLAPVAASWQVASALSEVRGLAERLLFAAMIAVLISVDRVFRAQRASTAVVATGRSTRQQGGYPHRVPTATRGSWRP